MKTLFYEFKYFIQKKIEWVNSKVSEPGIRLTIYSEIGWV